MFRSKEEKLQLLDKAIQVHDGNAITAVSVGKKIMINTVVPRFIAPRYIANVAYRPEIVKNGFPSMLIPPL